MTVPTIDRLSQGAAAFFAVACCAMIVGLVQAVPGQAPALRIAMMAFLALLFGLLAALQFGNARSSLVIDGHTVTRTGPLGWSVPRNQIVEAQVVSQRTCVLVVVVSDRTAKRSAVARAISWSWWLQPRHRARNAIVTRIEPVMVPPVRAYLGLD